MLERPPLQQPRGTISLSKVPSPKKRWVAHTPPSAIQCAEIQPSSPRMPPLVVATHRRQSTLNRPISRGTPPRNPAPDRQAANLGSGPPHIHRQQERGRSPEPVPAPTHQAACTGPVRQVRPPVNQPAATALPPANLNSSSSSSVGEAVANMWRRLLGLIQRTHH